MYLCGLQIRKSVFKDFFFFVISSLGPFRNNYCLMPNFYFGHGEMIKNIRFNNNLMFDAYYVIYMNI